MALIQILTGVFVPTLIFDHILISMNFQPYCIWKRSYLILLLRIWHVIKKYVFCRLLVLMDPRQLMNSWRLFPKKLEWGTHPYQGLLYSVTTQLRKTWNIILTRLPRCFFTNPTYSLLLVLRRMKIKKGSEDSPNLKLGEFSISKNWVDEIVSIH